MLFHALLASFLFTTSAHAGAVENFRATGFYERLEVEKSASEEQLKAAYRRLSKKYHPDTGGNEELFKLLGEAYDTLKDQSKRAFYDRFGDPRVVRETRPPPPPKSKPSTRPNPDALDPLPPWAENYNEFVHYKPTFPADARDARRYLRSRGFPNNAVFVQLFTNWRRKNEGMPPDAFLELARGITTKYEFDLLHGIAYSQGGRSALLQPENIRPLLREPDRAKRQLLALWAADPEGKLTLPMAQNLQAIEDPAEMRLVRLLAESESYGKFPEMLRYLKDAREPVARAALETLLRNVDDQVMRPYLASHMEVLKLKNATQVIALDHLLRKVPSYLALTRETIEALAEIPSGASLEILAIALDHFHEVKDFAALVRMTTGLRAPVTQALLEKRVTPITLLSDPYRQALLEMQDQAAVDAALERIAQATKNPADAMLGAGFWSRLLHCNTLYGILGKKKAPTGTVHDQTR